MANKNRLIKTFMDLVQIDSPTGEEDAMDQEVSNRLEALGFSVYHDSFKNVIANLSGIGDPIVLSAHLDTVCLLYTSPSPRDGLLSRMPSSA